MRALAALVALLALAGCMSDVAPPPESVETASQEEALPPDPDDQKAADPDEDEPADEEPPAPAPPSGDPPARRESVLLYNGRHDGTGPHEGTFAVPEAPDHLVVAMHLTGAAADAYTYRYSIETPEGNTTGGFGGSLDTDKDGICTRRVFASADAGVWSYRVEPGPAAATRVVVRAYWGLEPDDTKAACVAP